MSYAPSAASGSDTDESSVGSVSSTVSSTSTVVEPTVATTIRKTKSELSECQCLTLRGQPCKIKTSLHDDNGIPLCTTHMQCRYNLQGENYESPHTYRNEVSKAYLKYVARCSCATKDGRRCSHPAVVVYVSPSDKKIHCLCRQHFTDQGCKRTIPDNLTPLEVVVPETTDTVEVNYGSNTFTVVDPKHYLLIPACQAIAPSTGRRCELAASYEVDGHDLCAVHAMRKVYLAFVETPSPALVSRYGRTAYRAKEKKEVPSKFERSEEVGLGKQGKTSKTPK